MALSRSRFNAFGLFAFAVLASCRFDSAYRDGPEVVVARCTEGVVECRGSSLVRCQDKVPVVIDDCGARGQACAGTLLRCTPCLPEELTCDGASVLKCDSEGQKRSAITTCDTEQGFACRGGACTELCSDAARNKSNIGCEYWPVDLDNGVLPEGHAAAQQYAVIVSNPQPDVAARVTFEVDDAEPGETPKVRIVSEATVGVRHLEVFKLGPREVDGSTPDKPNGGTGTALSRRAFRLRSNVPVVAYQFNPLENVNVFSNDATILLPTTALNGSGRGYVVAGWPQTIAKTDNAATNWGRDLRAFLAVVGTSPDTMVRVKTAARIIPGGPFPDGVSKDSEVEVKLQPFEVLNLETGDFNADFTGSTIESTAPVAVYVGSEASDSPFYSTISERSCCADHLETQVTPLRAVGSHYVIGRMPSRSKAVAAAGGGTAFFNEPEMYRIVATKDGTTTVKTTLAAPWDSFTLEGVGAHATIAAAQDFKLDADRPVLVADVQVSQEAAGISIQNGLPGGDPSLLLVPPVEQWRTDYLMLTPDKYAFDFLVITAPNGATVYVDGLPIDGRVCETSKNAEYTVYRCQLSFPVVNPFATIPNIVQPGRQNDGVHRVQSDYPVGVLVYGFDYRVSYAYVGGTELIDVPPAK